MNTTALARAARSNPDALFKCSSVGRTHAGCVRPLNEDAFLEAADKGVWAVADGMGGHNGGDVASAEVIDRLARAEAKPNRFAATVAALEAANEVLQARGQEDFKSSIGSTAAVLVMDGAKYECLWAGDSRIYLYRSHQLRLLTHDHSYVQELVDAGVVSAEQARVHPRRNVITRAVGAAPHLEVDRATGPVSSGDRFLLCSDGLNAVVSEREIADHMRRAPLEQAAEKLMSSALARGAPDNVTVVVVSVEVHTATCVAEL